MALRQVSIGLIINSKMIISEEEAKLRLESPNNLGNKLFEIRKLHTNRTGPKNIPESTKEMLVGLSAITNRKSVAETFGVVAHQTIDYYEKQGYGETSKETIHEAALDAMLQSIKLIPEKLKGTKKATDLSTVAANLARVVEKTSPQIEKQTNVQVIVYAPRVKDEKEYEEAVV